MTPSGPAQSIYLIRHAHAASNEDDAARALSERGRAQVEALCAELRLTGAFAPEQIWHSPLVRARETAELLRAGLGLTVPVLEQPGLRPDDPPGPIAEFLLAEPRATAVVGHEPNLAALAELIARHGRRGSFFSFPKASVLALRRRGQRWRMEWLAQPS